MAKISKKVAKKASPKKEKKTKTIAKKSVTKDQKSKD